MAAHAIASSLLARLIPPKAPKPPAPATDGSKPDPVEGAPVTISLEMLFSKLLAEACDPADGNAVKGSTDQPQTSLPVTAEASSTTALPTLFSHKPAPHSAGGHVARTSRWESKRSLIASPADQRKSMIDPPNPTTGIPVPIAPGLPQTSELAQLKDIAVTVPVQRPAVEPDLKVGEESEGGMPTAHAVNPLGWTSEHRSPQVRQTATPKDPERHIVEKRGSKSDPSEKEPSRTDIPDPTPSIAEAFPPPSSVDATTPLPATQGVRPTDPPHRALQQPAPSPATHARLAGSRTSPNKSAGNGSSQTVRGSLHVVQPVPWTPPTARHVDAQTEETPSGAELPAPPDTAEIKVATRRSAESGEVAFLADLVPITRIEGSLPGQGAQSPAHPLHDAQHLPASVARSAGESASGPQERESQRESQQDPASRPHKLDAAPQPPPASHFDQQSAGPNRVMAHPPVTEARGEAPSSSSHTPNETRNAAVLKDLETTPEMAKPPMQAREIRLQVAGGEQKVEVQLIDRGGEVRVAVRTPDSNLAERLRENLPELSSRLTESGFHAETWRPHAVAGTDWRQANETRDAHFGNESNQQSRQEGRQQQQERDEQPHRQPAPDPNEKPKEKGKNFEWLMSTIH